MREQSSCTSAEAGFTFIEVLVAMAVLSLSGFILWTGLDGAMKSIEKIHNRNNIVSEISRFEYLFRTEINRLGPAYWETGIDDYSGLYMMSNSLCLDTGHEKNLFYNIDLETLELKDSGIEVVLSSLEWKEIRVFANFGSFSLTTGDNP